MHSRCSEYLDPCNAGFFKKWLAKLKPKLSPEASIVSSNPKLTRLLHQQLTANSLQFKITKQARDLGISHASGRSRPDLLIKERLAKCKTRILKISKLAKSSRKASARGLSIWLPLKVGDHFIASYWSLSKLSLIMPAGVMTP